MTEKQSQGVFEPGDRVLVLFPVVGNPLQAKYFGPYKVKRKLVTQITWSKLLVDVRKQKCVISICSKHIMKNQTRISNT